VDIDFNKLKTLTVVAEFGQMSAAARSLRRSQPAISRQIQILEQELGLRLVEHKKGRIELTPEGAAVANFAREGLQSLELKLAGLKRDVTQPEGRIRLMALNDGGNLFDLGAKLAPFLKRYPKIHLELSYGTNEAIESSLNDGAQDLGVAVIFKEKRRLTRWPLSEDAHNFYATKEFLAQHKGSLKHMLGAPLVDLSSEFLCLKPWFKKNSPALLTQLKHHAPHVVAPDFRAVFEMIRAGSVAGVLPEHLAQADEAKGRLVKVLKGAKPTRAGLDLAIRAHRTARACEQALIDHLTSKN